MRVKRGGEATMTDHIGITPAHAGKTADTLKDMANYWDHPRACG